MTERIEKTDGKDPFIFGFFSRPIPFEAPTNEDLFEPVIETKVIRFENSRRIVDTVKINTSPAPQPVHEDLA